MAGQRLTSAERIGRRSEFERAYENGARVHGRLMTVFVVPNGLEVSRLGIAATRKLGSAVARNRAKRHAREVFRRHKVTSGLDIVIVPRREMLDAPFASIEADYLDALGRRSGVPARTRTRGRRHTRPASRV